MINFCRFPPDKNWLFNSTLLVLTENLERILLECSFIFFSLINPPLKKLESLKLFNATFYKFFSLEIIS